MKSFTRSYLLSLTSAIAGAIFGALLVAVPFVLWRYPDGSERIQFFLRWIVPFVLGFAAVYGLIDAVVRKNYLAIRRWTRSVWQSML